MSSSISSASLSITEVPEGEVDGRPVKRLRLANASGMVVEILNYGGIIATVEFPDRAGKTANLVLGMPSLDDYVSYNAAPTSHNPRGKGPYLGAIIGRYANRIGGGQFELRGQQYQVPVNAGGNALHGGDIGFDQRVWDARMGQGHGTVSVRLEYLSPDGEMGFPGELRTVATYTLDDDNRLSLRMQATTNRPTVVNLTNHTYWNLAGEAAGTIYGHQVSINADSYTPVGEAGLPTGEIAAVEGTPFDFRQLRVIGDGCRVDHPQLTAAGGYDHNWVLDQTTPRSLVLAATAIDPHSGRRMDLYTTQPGCQFYTGNYFDGGITGTSGVQYSKGAGFALEPQHFPNSPNVAHFPSSELAQGEMYDETMVFRLSVEP